MYLFIVFDCLAELKKESKLFFFLVLYLTNTNYTYTLMSEGKKRQQQKLLQNNKWLKGIKKDLVKKKTTTKTNNELVFRLFSYETESKKTWDT